MIPLSPQRRNFLLDLALIVLIVCFAAILSVRGSLRGFDGRNFDVLVRMKCRSPVHKSNVAIVCIDQNSLTRYSADGNGWPWPREFHARLVQFLTDCGVKAIVFDMILSEQDNDRVNAGKGDKEFSEAIGASGRTILVLEAKSDSTGIFPTNRTRMYLPDNDLFGNFRLTNHLGAAYPLSVLARDAAGIGLANAVLDGDGIVRRYPLAMKLRGKYVPSLALTVARVLRGDRAVESWIRDALREGTRIDSEGNLRLHWYGKGDVGGVFTYYSYRRVMTVALNEEMTGKPDSLRDELKDKIVIVGSNAPGLLDQKSTPVSSGEAYPGMEVHATAIENFLADEFLSTVPRWIVLLVMAAVCALLFIVIKTTKSLRLFVAVFFGCIAAEFAVSWLLILRDIWFPSVGVYLATTLVFIDLVTSGYFTETREKRLLRRHFERYVNDSVLEEILANPNAVDLKGRTIQATVMATDIRDFTAISENMHAYDVVARLNDYLSEVSEVLINHGAFINKYIGDAILALYGAFGENPAHREQACRAAIAAAEVINRMAGEARAEGKVPFITRFGLYTGEMTMGNIGSARKIEYTVIGDAVNSAFRLEGINKYYDTRILVSEFTREGAGEGFEFRLVDVLQLKGKDRPVRIYELLGEKGKVDETVMRRRDDYERAFSLYTGRRFEEAHDEFARLSVEGDPASGVLEKRCRQFMEEPPPEDWNGVERMFTK